MYLFYLFIFIRPFSDCLVLSDGETLIIGRIDDIQKLHMRCVHLGESPARMAHQPQTGTLAIITHRDEVSTINILHVIINERSDIE